MRIKKDSFLLNKPIAHRGLWGKNIAENSTSAYSCAVDNGYPIEIDLYSTCDNEIVCFHDDTLFRMTGKEGFIYDKTLAELKELNISEKQEKIPTLKEVLTLVNGKVPLLIEFKNQPDISYVPLAVELLKKYSGEFAVQSFNPLILLKIKKLAPYFIRGVLSSHKPDTKSKLERFIVSKMPLNFLVKPDFISYDYSGLALNKKRFKNIPTLAWTVCSQKTADEISEYSDNFIFEGFIPKSN